MPEARGNVGIGMTVDDSGFRNSSLVIAFETVTELSSARAKHPKPMNSAHEAYAVIQEELDEAWDEIKKKTIDRQALREELIQVAAMAMRAIGDLGL